MIGKRSRKEPMREAKTWRKRSKVWNKLEKSGIARFIESSMVLIRRLPSSW